MSINTLHKGDDDDDNANDDDNNNNNNNNLFRFSGPFLHLGVQGPSFFSLLLSVLMFFFLLLLIHHSILLFFFSFLFAQQMSKITVSSIASCSYTRLTWFTGSQALLRMVLSVFHL